MEGWHHQAGESCASPDDTSPRGIEKAKSSIQRVSDGETADRESDAAEGLQRGASLKKNPHDRRTEGIGTMKMVDLVR